MVYLLNALSLILCYAWNAGILLGTMWLIIEKDWSPWTLVVTILFISNLDRYSTEKKPEDSAPKILMETK